MRSASTLSSYAVAAVWCLSAGTVAQAWPLTVDVALWALAAGGDVQRAVGERGLTDWPGPEAFSLAPKPP
jgi:hypothetical protein